MRANTSQKQAFHTLKTIYCAFFLAFFIAGAICGYFLSEVCDKQILQRHCVAVCLRRQGFLWLIVPIVRFASLFLLCGRFRIGVFFMPLLIFLRGVSAVFYVSAFCMTLPESVTFGRGIAYFAYLSVTLTVLIVFGWQTLRRLYGRNFGRTSYG